MVTSPALIWSSVFELGRFFRDAWQIAHLVVNLRVTQQCAYGMLTEGLVVVQICLEIQFHLLGVILCQLVLGCLDRSILNLLW